MQDWPVLRNLASSTPSTARFRSASSKTMHGAWPPSSSDNFFTSRAAPWISFWPTSVEPVKVIFLQIGFDKNSSPIIDAEPFTSWNTPLGSFASLQHSANAMLHNGVWLAGLRIVGQPAASAGAIL